MLKRVLSLMLTLAIMSCGITVFASEDLISNVVIAETAEVGKNLEVTYDLADGVKESDVSVNWYIASPGDDVFYDTGVTGKNFLVEYAHAGMGIKAKVSAGDVEVWSNTVTESLTSLVSVDDKFDKDLVISSSDGYTINSGTVQRNATDNVLELVKGTTKDKITRNFPAVTGKFAFSFKVKNSASFATSIVVGGSGGVATILTYNEQKITASVLNDAGNAAATFTAGNNYAVGAWHLLSGAFDTDSDTFSLYVDGKKVFDKKGFRTVLNGAPVDVKNISYVYYEIPANAAGNSYIDNVNVRKIHPLPVCETPVAENVTILGSNRIGSAVSVDYDYSGDYMEYGTEYSWYVSTEEDGIYTKLADKTDKSLVIDESVEGMYIKAGVKPANIWYTVGKEALSAPRFCQSNVSVGLENGFASIPAEKFVVKAGTAGDGDVSIENGSLKIMSDGNTGHKPEITYSLAKPFTGETAYVDLLIKNTSGAALCYIQGTAGAGVRVNIDSVGNMKVNDTVVAPTMDAEKWYRLRLVVKPVGNTTDAAINVYVDGVLKAERLTLKAAMNNFTSVFTAKTAAGTLFIDELKIFTTDLSGGILENGIEWKYDESIKTLTFTGKGAMPDYSTVVDKADPTYFENKDWNSFIAEVENVVIEEGITAVGSNCFRSASNLKTVTLPASCESINAYAFIRSGVETITMPEGLKSIGDGAFAYVTTLTEVTLPKSLTNIHTYAFGGDVVVKTINAYNNTAAEAYAKEKGIYLVLLDVVNTTKYDAATKSATIYAPEAVEDVAVFFASYDGDELQTVKYKENVDLTKGINTVPIEEFTTVDGHKIKVFVWSGLSDITPVAEAFEQ